MRTTTRGQTRHASSAHGGVALVTAAAFAALTAEVVRPQARSLVHGVRCDAYLRRTATAVATLPCASSPCCTSMALLFTDAKKSYARGTEEEQRARQEASAKEWRSFLNQPVDPDGGNAPTARSVEDRLPTKKQLNEELPTAMELEKALRDGTIDTYTMRPDEHEE
ncbi:hypothetical protein GH5_08440 [Leishmania sp. Ghana 2012 LV757]|uniref:hypothetical protein n=1 Tax=Leishmania sp. Ghana 2012 LV757 TaxID=2803181 RepID=UPI001B710031|nr:hypothetical protein GH5_08440 [Leishmania sp. Ghana 2012 LV757]